MASSMAVPRSSRSIGSGRGKNIPLITHPMANLGNMTDLTIRGTSSLGLHRQKTDVSSNRTKQDLGTNVRRSNTAVNNERDAEVILDGRKSCPDRILQWPPVCDFVPPYSYRKSTMPTGFLPKIEEAEEQKYSHRKNTEVDIGIVEYTVKGKKKDRLQLPPIEKIVELVKEQREYLVGPKASAVKCDDLQFSPARDKVLELTDIVRERLTTGYYGLRHLFRANDPTGQGNVSREALLRILYSLCGFITREQYSKFLKSLGLEGKETIAFDNFVACFKENETVQKQWVSPVQRSALEEALKRRHPEDRLKLDLKRHDPYTSAPFSDTIFKSKLKTIEDARKVFPPICFEPDGMIVPPQLREAYAHIGIYLHDSDFQVLWDRYDTEGSGGIRTIPFLRKLGCDLNPRPKTFHRSHTQIPVQQPQRPKSDHFLYKSLDIIDKVQHDVETNTAVQVEKTTEKTGNGVIKTTEKSETTLERESKTESTECETKVKQAKPKLRKGQPKLDNIIDCLHYRFEESYNAILTAFELFDHLSDGYISRVDFRRVLQEFGFNISITDLDHFLSRASIRSIRGQLNYKEFLYKYQSKSENSMTNRIVTNQSHIFQHDSQPLPNSNLSVEEMEAKLVDYFHGDFLKLMSYLKSCDKYGLGVITPHEFRGALEKRLGYTMSDKQWEQLKTDVGQDADGLIPYNKFLQLFDVIKATKKRPGSWNKKQEGGVDVVKVVKSDMPTPAAVELLMKEKAKTSISFKEVDKLKIDGAGNRTIVELKRLLEELFKNKFHTFDKHFKQMDRKMMGRMSKWQFGALIKLCGLTMNQQELDKVWATLSIANDGMYSYSALIRHFIQFKNKNKTAENVLIDDRNFLTEDTTEAVERAHQVQRERREKKAHETHASIEKVEPELQKTAPSSAISVKSVRTKDLLVKVKPDVISNWEGLKSVFKYIDKNGCATVNYNEITEVMESMKFNLSAEELKELILRFDLQKNGRFHYLEFMKCFSHRPVPASRYKTLVYSKHAHKLEQKVAARNKQRDIGSATVAQVINNMRKKMMNEHRNLKRAFKKIDRQNRGYLSVMDFKKVLTSCKVSFSNEDFYHILSEFDHNMTGKISYQDFLTTFMNANI
ncbi:EF-hand calcium-binding domain-containing protein 6-like isoform X15 [Mytilus californianus]|uniref:EF-hand calcium-binding domain-containing protein 6-like isoform X15 n=1 Tax=Mytilus californianus TaxID=6549 RepID=UPI0022475BF9|nr:EF-hand calcium-binding domain-containing protein 6-like isoform X15 [Mytilus californianus]